MWCGAAVAVAGVLSFEEFVAAPLGWRLLLFLRRRSGLFGRVSCRVYLCL